MRVLLTGFGKYTIEKLVVRANAIKDGLTAATWCNDPWPSPFPSKAQVVAAAGDFLAKAALADDGGAGPIANRDVSRGVMEGLLTSAAPYLQALAAGDLAKLEETGYEISKERATGSPSLPGAPGNVKLKHGSVTGTLFLGSRAEKGATAYEGQLATDPNSDASFTIKVISSGCRKIVFADVTPGVVYYGRVRAIGPAGTGPWSDVAQIRAL